MKLQLTWAGPHTRDQEITFLELKTEQGFGESASVQVFSVSQGHDGRVIVAFASTRRDSAVGDAYVLGPIMPANLRQLTDRDLQAFLLKAKGQPDNLVFNKFFTVSAKAHSPIA